MTDRPRDPDGGKHQISSGTHPRSTQLWTPDIVRRKIKKMTTPGQPGWYDDPQDSNAQRYWDGQNWTPHRQRKNTTPTKRHPAVAPPPPPQMPPPPLPPASPQMPPPPLPPASPQMPPPPLPPASPQMPPPPPGPAGGPSPWEQVRPYVNKARDDGRRFWSRQPRQRKIIWAVAGAVVAIVAAITFSHTAGSPRTLGRVTGTPGHSDQSNGSSSPSPGRVTGTSDEWIESVCKTGSYQDGEGGPDTVGGANCSTKDGSGEILIRQYDSDFKMRNAVAQLFKLRQDKYYASGIDSDGTIEVFFADSGDLFAFSGGSSSILEPLTQFGFTINTAPEG
jgi:hypothetical protein